VKRVEADVRIFTVTQRDNPPGQMARAIRIVRGKESNGNAFSFIKNTRGCQVKNSQKHKYLIYHSFFNLLYFFGIRVDTLSYYG
jgi:hypothetical protein